MALIFNGSREKSVWNRSSRFKGQKRLYLRVNSRLDWMTLQENTWRALLDAPDPTRSLHGTISRKLRLVKLRRNCLFASRQVPSNLLSFPSNFFKNWTNAQITIYVKFKKEQIASEYKFDLYTHFIVTISNLKFIKSWTRTVVKKSGGRGGRKVASRFEENEKWARPQPSRSISLQTAEKHDFFARWDRAREWAEKKRASRPGGRLPRSGRRLVASVRAHPRSLVRMRPVLASNDRNGFIVEARRTKKVNNDRIDVGSPIP